MDIEDILGRLKAEPEKVLNLSRKDAGSSISRDRLASLPILNEILKLIINESSNRSQAQIYKKILCNILLPIYTTNINFVWDTADLSAVGNILDQTLEIQNELNAIDKDHLAIELFVSLRLLFLFSLQAKSPLFRYLDTTNQTGDQMRREILQKISNIGESINKKPIYQLAFIELLKFLYNYINNSTELRLLKTNDSVVCCSMLFSLFKTEQKLNLISPYKEAISVLSLIPALELINAYDAQFATDRRPLTMFLSMFIDLIKVDSSKQIATEDLMPITVLLISLCKQHKGICQYFASLTIEENASDSDLKPYILRLMTTSQPTVQNLVGELVFLLCGSDRKIFSHISQLRNKAKFILSVISLCEFSFCI